MQMGNYLLLRDNQQSGPYSFEQLKTSGVLPTDLIWVQGRSEGWAYAAEIEELKVLFQLPSPDRVSELSSKNFPLETNYTRPLHEIKEMYVDHLQKTGKTRWYKAALIASVAAILVLGGLLIKKSMEPEEVVIKDSVVAPPRGGEPVTNSENFQNALSKEFIPYEAKPKKVKPKDLKKLVSVQVNDYEVKILGGIKDVEITVQNFSEYLLDEVTVKIDYLKPKGEVVNSEVVTVTNIKPQESKIAEVPSSPRGVKVKYTIVDIRSQSYKAVLEQL